MITSLNEYQIILTRAEKQQESARSLFENSGVLTLDLPTLVIGPPNDWTPMDMALKDLESFDWLLFSSANGVQAFEERLANANSTLTVWSHRTKVASIGSKTSSLLKKLGCVIDYIPPQFVADSLIEYFPISSIGVKILIIRVESGGRSILKEALIEAGISVVEVSGYQSSCPQSFPANTMKALCNKKVSAITFTSSKTVQHACRLLEKCLGSSWRSQLKSLAIVSIGPQTSITCYEWLGRVDAEANPHNLEGLLVASFNALGKPLPIKMAKSKS